MFAIHEINGNLSRIIHLLEGDDDGEARGRRKTTPEQWAEWQRTEDRLREVLERRLAENGLTREQLERRAYESLRKSLED